MARLPLSNALPLIDATGRALSGVQIRVRPHSDTFIANNDVAGSLATTAVPVYVAPTGGSQIADGSVVTAVGTAPGYVEEGYYDLIIGADGSLATTVMRPYPFMDAAGTALLRANSVATGNIVDGTVTALDMAAGMLPSNSTDALAPDVLQQGVLDGTDLALSFTSATAVAISGTTAVTGGLWVKNAAGLMLRKTVASTTNLTAISATATNPRLDQVVYDTNDNTVKRVVGTETVGATIVNRTGATSLTAGQFLLHDLLVTTTGVINAPANIRDRRLNARGATRTIIRTAGDYSIASATMAAIDATNLAPRIECSGRPMEVTLDFLFTCSVSSDQPTVWLFYDGASYSGMATTGNTSALWDATAGVVVRGTHTWELTPTAGSHTFAPAAHIGSGTLTIKASAGAPLAFSVKELRGSNWDNGI